MTGFWRKCYIELLYLMEKYEKNASHGRVSKKMLHWIIVSEGQMKKEYIKWWGFEENVALNYCIWWRNENVALNYCIWWRNEERIHQVVGFWRKCCIELLYLMEKWRKNTSSGGVSKKNVALIIVFDGEMKKKYIKWWGFKEKCCIELLYLMEK